MRTHLLIMGVLILWTPLWAMRPGAAGQGGQGSSPPDSRIGSVVGAERAFAQLSVSTSMDSAFITFLADDAVLLRPHPVQGKPWMRAHRSSGQFMLDWRPAIAGVAAAGDLGYTSGPYELSDLSPQKRPKHFGTFATVWKKQPGGAWKVVFDMGAPHPASADSATMGMRSSVTDASPRSRSRAPGQDSARCGASLALADSALSEMLSTGPSASNSPMHFRTLSALLDDHVRVLRAGQQTAQGKRDAGATLTGAAKRISTRPLHSEASRSCDLGYIYGTYVLEGKDHTQGNEKGYYLRIWSRAGGIWRLLLDVTTALPAGS